MENIPMLSLPGRFQKIRFQDERIRIHFMDAESQQFFIQIREHELGKFKCGLVSLGFKRDGIDMGQNCVLECYTISAVDKSPKIWYNKSK